ncbi:hypothetical protein XA68_11856 [Ophiocordyceps unilateralis]|uniref:RRM domain-containing protein n=1 Tax=Ophiocordyceps unilateralis TaxID=268505 RepID=A0A2A9PEP1_OPHUN|nr:hypothetical protein XA68_11856 [Ophiocordyceps unilateralis]
MNKIRAIQALNQKEIEQGVSPDASWHTDYRDTAYVYFGGLPYEISEGDVITIFSQYGEPVFLKLARDKETGKSKGFGWLKYHDQRSTDLAVDNLGGAEIGGRLISVDHARYKPRDDEDPDEFKVGWEDMKRREGRPVSDDESSDEDDDDEDEEKSRPLLPEEEQLAALVRDHDDDDPMKTYLIEEKKKQVEDAKRRADKRERRHRHSHHHSSYRSRREDPPVGDRVGRPRRDHSPRDLDRRRDDRDGRRGDLDDSGDRQRRHRRKDHDDDHDDGEINGRRRDSRDRERRHQRTGHDDYEDDDKADGQRHRLPEPRGRDGYYSKDRHHGRDWREHERPSTRSSRSRSPRPRGG